MTTNEQTPLLLCGKIPTYQAAVCAIVEPEYKIHNVCDSNGAAISKLQEVFTSSDAIKPKAVIMGGGFSHADFESVRNSVPESKNVPWIRPYSSKPGQVQGPQVPPAEVVANACRKVLDAHMDDLREGKGAEEVWWMGGPTA